MKVGRFVLAAILIAALAQSASARPAQRQYLSEIDGDAPVSRRQLAMMAASTAVSEPSRSALAIRPSKIASIYGRCRADGELGHGTYKAMLRNCDCGTGGCLLVLMTALATDLIPTSETRWEGFYVGAELGGTWSDTEFRH